jgi:hypothetical protein
VVGIVGIDTGIPLIEGGVAVTVLSDGTLVLVGGGAVVVGGVLVLEGAGTAVSGAVNLGQNVSAFAGDGRPKRNDVQNKQFDGAVRQLERELGRKLDDPDEINELHRELHHYPNPGFWDIVQAGLDLFWRGD